MAHSKPLVPPPKGNTGPIRGNGQHLEGECLAHSTLSAVPPRVNTNNARPIEGICTWPIQDCWQYLRGILVMLGPFKTIGSISLGYLWAHSRPSVGADDLVASQEQHWAHSRKSGASSKRTLGPFNIFSSTCGGQHWAHLRQSAVAEEKHWAIQDLSRETLGPLEATGRTSEEIVWPTWDHRQHLSVACFAHSGLLAVLLRSDPAQRNSAVSPRSKTSLI